MDRDERRQLRDVTEQVTSWASQARAIVAMRAGVNTAARRSVDALARGVIEIKQDGESAWRVMLLHTADEERLGHVARDARLPVLSDSEEDILARLTGDVAAATHDVQSAIGARRFFSSKQKREDGREAGRFLNEFYEWGRSVDLSQRLRKLSDHGDGAVQVSASEALSDWVGFKDRVAHLGNSPELLPYAATAGLAEAVRTIRRALEEEERLRRQVISAGEGVRRAEARRLLAEMPVERLREATRDRLRIGPLTDAGITTVQAVLDRGNQLEGLPGIGDITATRVRGAAQTSVANHVRGDAGAHRHQAPDP